MLVRREYREHLIVPKKRQRSSISGIDGNAILGAIAAASLDALITIDASGNIIEFSPVAESMFGYQRNEVIGIPVSEVVIPPHLRQAHTDGMAKYHRDGTGPVINTRVQVPAIRRTGEEFPAELTVVPLEVSGKKLFTAFVRDITELKAHEAEMESARKHAEEASQAKSRFLAHMSHELRSPLTTVLGAVDLLLDSGLDDKQTRFASMARNSGTSLLEIITNILDFSKIEAGELDIEGVEFNLFELIWNFTDTYSQKVIECGINFDIYFSEALPRKVIGDFKRLRQVLINYLDNAIKFTHEGGVLLKVTQLDVNNDKSRIRFSVKDTGIGIPEEKLSSIFDEFIQVDSSDSTAYSGTGLGLSIVRLIAENMEASVGATSDEANGSEFWLEIELPYLSPPDPITKFNTPINSLIISQNDLTVECLGNYLADLGVTYQVVPALSEISTRTRNQADLYFIDMDSNPSSIGEQVNAAIRYDINPSQICLLENGLQVEENNTSKAHPYMVLRKPFCLHDVGHLLGLVKESLEPSALEETSLAGIQQRPRILLAEDSISNQIILKAMLESQYDVTVVTNGEEALKAIADSTFDVVLMDLRMPHMDGIEATEKIRRMEKGQGHLPIIALTANALTEDIQRCLKIGMDDFIVKPVNKAEFLGKIAEVIRVQEREHQARNKS